MGSAEAQFREAYAAWRSQPFPSGSANDELDELHADLALVDSWVAETVVPFVERGERDSPGVDVAQGIDGLADRVSELSRSAAEADQRLVAGYREYVERLRHVFESFTQMSSDVEGG